MEVKVMNELMNEKETVGVVYFMWKVEVESMGYWHGWMTTA